MGLRFCVGFQGCRFSDYGLISYFFTLILMIFFYISYLEHVSNDFMIESDFQKIFVYYDRLFHRT